LGDEKQTEYLKQAIVENNLGTFILKENKNGSVEILKGKKKLLTLHLVLNICLKNISENRNLNESEINLFEKCVKNDVNYKIELTDKFANQFYKDFVVDKIAFQLPQSEQEEILRSYYENINGFIKSFDNAEMILSTFEKSKTKITIIKK
jgi:hypothetical protein